MSASLEGDDLSRRASPREEQGDDARGIGDIWRRLGISGDAAGTIGDARRALPYWYIGSMVAAAAVCAINVITTQHEEPQYGLAAPIVWEASSWLSYTAFLWIVWIAFRIGPLVASPRWRLLVHIPAALLFSLAHVAGFVLLRELIYRLAGTNYTFGAFLPNFRYEFTKDAFTYALLIATLALAERLRRRQAPIETPIDAPACATFDIRDGAKLARVRLDQILAVASAGNYVEFMLSDGRKLMMRSSLSQVENELGPHGFVRTHRSWLVNGERMTALRPAGSGDYTVELGSLSVSLSRRFPAALAKLRGG